MKKNNTSTHKRPENSSLETIQEAFPQTAQKDKKLTKLVSCDARVELHVLDSQPLSPDLKLTTGHLESNDSDSFSSDEDSYESVEK
jgi:hypothetical protein